MASTADWQMPVAQQPRPENYAYDLSKALSSVVGLKATVPEDAFTAQTLGTDRSGSGVLIRESGLVLTVGYLITEADEIWLRLIDGRSVAGHALAYDQATGFGLVQALGRLDLPALPIGSSADVQVGDEVVIAGAGGRGHSAAARVIAKQEFAGYWEYVLDEAIFTAPAHPFWGGTAMIGASGELLGIGSLQLEQAADGGQGQHLNMIVPIDLLKPIIGDLTSRGQVNQPPRPWLGVFATELGGRVIIAGLSENGPAARADLQTGDIVLSVAGKKVSDLAGLFRGIWALGNAGVSVPLTVERDGRTVDLSILSSDRRRYLKAPRLH